MDDYWKRLCSHAFTEGRIVSHLEGAGLSPLLKTAVLKEIIKPTVEISSLEETVHDSIANSRLLIHLKNAVYQELFVLLEEGVGTTGAPAHVLKEPVEFIRSAQEKWESRLKLAINRLCTNYKAVLSKLRSPQEKEILRKRWSSIGADYPDPCDYHPIYGWKDLLSAILQVKDPHYTPLPHPHIEGVEEEGADPASGAMQASINVKSLQTLRKEFKSLHPSQVQIESGSTNYLEKSSKVVRNGLWSLAKELCKTGCEIGHRRELWCMSLAIDTSQPEHAFHYEELKCQVVKYMLVFEKLVVNDVKKTAANDDNYFVFEDIMHQTLLCFLHDTSLLHHYQHLSPTPFSAYLKGKADTTENEVVVYPPSGIIPFHGFSLYIAPLCFLFERPDHLYALFKQMYIRFFVHLHSLSSHSQGILSLCCQFEALLQCREPELFRHLNHINAKPLGLAFGWLMSAFSGYLDSRELLLLWDRVIGFNSLTIVAVLAVGIFEFRTANLFKATKQNEAEDVLSDLRCIRVLPLLQQTLFL